MPGFDVRVVDLSGVDLAAGTDGDIVIRLPLPPGCLPTLWGDEGLAAGLCADRDQPLGMHLAVVVVLLFHDERRVRRHRFSWVQHEHLALSG